MMSELTKKSIATVESAFILTIVSYALWSFFIWAYTKTPDFHNEGLVTYYDVRPEKLEYQVGDKIYFISTLTVKEGVKELWFNDRIYCTNAGDEVNSKYEYYSSAKDTSSDVTVKEYKRVKWPFKPDYYIPFGMGDRWCKGRHEISVIPNNAGKKVVISVKDTTPFYIRKYIIRKR